MPTLAVRPVTAHGVARCPACAHYLPARTDSEVTCTFCGVTFPVD